MKNHTFQQRQFFSLSLEEIFDFFSNPGNLERITPPFLNFRIRTPMPLEMKEGLQIDYSLKLRGLPIRWTSEIEVWDPPYRFVDRQVRGPYRYWLHEHSFWEEDGGTWMEDQVEYAVPGGELVRRLFVDRDIRRIFEYRTQALTELLEEDSNRLASV